MTTLNLYTVICIELTINKSMKLSVCKFIGVFFIFNFNEKIVGVLEINQTASNTHC